MFHSGEPATEKGPGAVGKPMDLRFCYLVSREMQQNISVTKGFWILSFPLDCGVPDGPVFDF